MIAFRKANMADAEALAKIRSIFLLEANDVCSENERLRMEAANSAYFKTALADDSFAAWIALDENEIVATSGLCFSIVPPSFKCPDGKVAYIMNMFTFPKHRGKGIGTELFNRIVEEAKKRGFKKIMLTATNMGRPLYEKYGFKEAKGDMEFYPD